MPIAITISRYPRIYKILNHLRYSKSELNNSSLWFRAYPIYDNRTLVSFNLIIK